MNLHRDGTIPTLKEKSNREFSPQLEGLIARALTKQKIERFDSFLEIIDILSQDSASGTASVPHGIDKDSIGEKLNDRSQTNNANKLPAVAIYAAAATLIGFASFQKFSNKIPTTPDPPKNDAITSGFKVRTKALESDINSMVIAPDQPVLDLTDDEISKAQLEFIGKHNQLSKLRFYRCLIDNRGLPALAGMSNLIELNVAHSSLDDNGVNLLSACDKLEIVRIDSTPITDRGMRSLARMKSIRDLNVMKTKVSGKGLLNLMGSKTLQVIDLCYTDVDESSIRAICKKTPSLKKVYIFGCRFIGEDAVQKLEAEFPQKVENRERDRKDAAYKDDMEGVAKFVGEFSLDRQDSKSHEDH